MLVMRPPIVFSLPVLCQVNITGYNIGRREDITKIAVHRLIVSALRFKIQYEQVLASSQIIPVFWMDLELSYIKILLSGSVIKFVLLDYTLRGLESILSINFISA